VLIACCQVFIACCQVFIACCQVFIACCQVFIACCQVFIACGTSSSRDVFRKPAPGMWRLLEQLNGGKKIDMERCGTCLLTP